MTWVAVAVGGGAAIAGLLGSQNAASAQRDAANQANATTMAQYNQTRQDQMPWMNRGNAAGNQMAYLLGLPGYGPSVNPTNGGSLGSVMAGGMPAHGTPFIQNEDGSYATLDGFNGGTGGTSYASSGLNGGQYNPALGGYGSLSTPFSATNWQADPGYAFRLSEGQKALERSGAARGMTLSGAQQKALLGYGQGMASQEYQNAYGRYNNDQTNLYNRLAGVAGTGQQATNMMGQFGANAANNVASNQIGAGNANAAGWIGGTNAISNGINQGINYWNNSNMWNSLMDQQNAGAAGTAYGNWMAANAGRVPYA